MQFISKSSIYVIHRKRNSPSSYKADMNQFLKIFFLFLIFSSATAQVEWEKYEPIVGYSDSNPEKLARSITANYETEEEKIQAIYYWVTHNIAYDMKLFEKMKKSKGDKKKYSAKEAKEKERKEVSKTLKSRKGVCQQYSTVFQSLCEGVGIQCKFIGGYGKANPKKSGLGGKHAWNAVYLDGNWYLVDATFSAGYVDEKKKFHYSFDPSYFFSDPDAFKLNHLPKQSKWQLTEDLIDKDTYKKAPGIGAGYFKHKLGILVPTTFKLSVEKGVPLVLSFTSPENLEELNVSSLRMAREITSEYTKEGDRYTIVVNTDELKSGSYGFYQGRDLLFVYRLSVN